MMKASFLSVLLYGAAARLVRKPLPLANLTMQKSAGSLAALKSEENDLVDTLFKIVEDLVEIEKKAAIAEAEAEAAAEAKKHNSTANLTTGSNASANASADHPNGIYGDPKQEYHESIWAKKKEDLKKAVAKLGGLQAELSLEKDAAKKKDLEGKVAAQHAVVDGKRANLKLKEKVIGKKFEVQCAKVLETMVSMRAATLAELGFPDDSVGLDMATHFQVQCPGAIPMPEDKCDKHATALAKLIDSDKPLVKKAALLQKPSAPESGNEWCTNFFGEFFKSVFHLVGCFEC